MSPKRSDVSGPTLPRGRHKLSREQVVSSQRDRLYGAMAQACAADGYGATTVAAVTARAGVSRKTFYEQFTDKEACFLAAYDAILGRVLRTVVGAHEARESPWPDRLRAAIEALLEFLAADHALAWMCFVDVLLAGPLALERYWGAVRLLASLVDEGRREAAAGHEPPAGAARAVVNGGAVLIRDRILAGQTAKLPELLPDILYATLVPYVGQAEALRHAT